MYVPDVLFAIAKLALPPQVSTVGTDAPEVVVVVVDVEVDVLVVGATVVVDVVVDVDVDVVLVGAAVVEVDVLVVVAYTITALPPL